MSLIQPFRWLAVSLFALAFSGVALAKDPPEYFSGFENALPATFSLTGELSLSGVPGGTIAPSATFDFGSGYEVLGWQLYVDYDPAKLSLASPVPPFTSHDASNGQLSQVFAVGLADPAILLSGQSAVLGSFTLLPGLAPGATTHITGWGVFLTGAGEVEGFARVITVTAVPEPGAWLMLLGGLAVVVAGRRRAARI